MRRIGERNHGYCTGILELDNIDGTCTGVLQLAKQYGTVNKELEGMSILVNKDTKVIVQGITGRSGRFHTQQCVEYGTQIVAGL